MKTSQAGIDLIKEWEGYAPVAYTCPGGKLTIGYGHVIKKGELFTAITMDEAEELLKADLKDAEGAIKDFVHVPLEQHQFDALASFIFNVGGSAFHRSTLLKKLNAGDYDGASWQFGRWVYASGRKLKGLENRRKAERRMFDGN